jgi:hypothetical protein
MRVVHTTVLLVTATAWGIWCGGDLTKFLGISLVGMTGALALLIIATLIMKNNLGRISLLAGTIVAISVGVVLGSGHASAAFNECMSRGEAVRKELASYKEQKGHYPDNLSELEMNLPGKRLLRSNILDYQRTEKGYDIKFQDWLITHAADENSEFDAHK